MKIGILTQPLHSNYGGLLQAWALQKTIAEMGHEVTIINRVYSKSNVPLWRKIAGKVKNEILIGLGKRIRYVPVTDELKKYSEQNVIKFRQKRYLGVSPELKTNKELEKYIGNSKFDAFIVGSDQVWRPAYSPNLMTYFLDFVKGNSKVKKIAYAASFGVDTWEFDEEQTKKAKELAPLFDLITVRESSGVKLVEDYLKCNASHVLDPTMLLDKAEYFGLIDNSTCPLKESDGDIFCYALDQSSTLSKTINTCVKETGLKPFYCNYKTPIWQITKDKKSDGIVPPVEQWLKSFGDAKMVITDSFHGVVFSIIFNKPFWVILNENRGATRFTSLLELFNLEERIICNLSNVDWNTPIDWESVNIIRAEKKLSSISLLSTYLK